MVRARTLRLRHPHSYADEAVPDCGVSEFFVGFVHEVLMALQALDANG